MKYKQDIIILLSEVGDAGLPLQSIVKHIYNAHNSLFEPIKEENVYQSVRSFLIKNSAAKVSLFTKGTDRKFRINNNSAEAKMLQLQFQDNKKEKKDNQPSTIDELPLLFTD